jgi:hypothetical protein
MIFVRAGILRSLCVTWRRILRITSVKPMETHENPNRQPTRVKAIALPAAEDNMLPHKTPEKPAEEQTPAESPNKEHRNQLLLRCSQLRLWDSLAR